MASATQIRDTAIAKAIEGIHSGRFPNAAQAAKAYAIAPTTLRERLRGATSLSERLVNNCALSNSQTQVLLDYIDRLDAVGMSPTIKMLESSANFILRGENRVVGCNWASRFVKRNPHLFVRKQKPLATERKEAQCEETLKKHFERFKWACRDIGLMKQDLYNMDETGFRIGCGKAHTIVTFERSKKLAFTDADNRDYISSIECINAVGWALPSFLIVAGAWILEKWCLENTLSNDTMITTSESGYSNDEIALQWLQRFDSLTASKRHGAWRMLVMDGHGSHMTLEFLEYAKANKIQLFAFPAHTTHLTQPLDVGVFQPYKHWHAQGVNHAMRCGETQFSKLDFFALFSSMKAKTMTHTTITHAWQKTGLMPYNPEVVLSQIRAMKEKNRNEETPSPSSSQCASYSQNFLQWTPHSSFTMTRFGEYLEGNFEDMSISDFRAALSRYVKASITAAHSRELAEDELFQTRSYAMAKKKRDALPNNVASKHGVVTVSMVRKKKRKRDEDELVKAQKAVEVAEARLEKEQLKAERERLKPWKELFRDLKKVVKERNKRLGYRECKYSVVHNPKLEDLE